VHKGEIAAPSARNDMSFFVIGYFLSLIKKGSGKNPDPFQCGGDEETRTRDLRRGRFKKA